MNLDNHKINLPYYMIGVLVLLLLLSTCNNRSIKNSIYDLNESVTQLQETIYDLDENQVTSVQLNLYLKLEGLKSELRMIQSTDRKVFDLKRQNEVIREIDELQNQLNQ